MGMFRHVGDSAILVRMWVVVFAIAGLGDRGQRGNEED